MSQDASSRWLAYVNDPTWLPHIYDPHTDVFVFARLPRELRQQLTFLDSRTVPASLHSEPAPAVELPRTAIRDSAGPLHFIFHSAFCCSTVLARALDIDGVSSGLREPWALTKIAAFLAAGVRARHVDAALAMTLDLLSRPLSPGETQVVKPSNGCNHMIPALLAARPDAKVILLYSDLDAFLRSTARRGGGGGAFVRELHKHFAGNIPLKLSAEEANPARLTDLQVAAQTWLMQIAVFDQLAKSLGPDRVRILHSQTLLDRKADVMDAVARFFELPIDNEQIAEIISGPAFTRYGKDPAVAFDSNSYRLQHRAAGAEHAAAIDAALTWAHRAAPRAQVPLQLEETLFA